MLLGINFRKATVIINKSIKQAKVTSTEQQHAEMQYGSASSKIQLETVGSYMLTLNDIKEKLQFFKTSVKQINNNNKKTIILKFNKKLSKQKFNKGLCVESTGIEN